MKLTRATSYALRALVVLTQCGEDHKSDLGVLARRLKEADGLAVEMMPAFFD